jgi:predicted DNA-binding protein with PD1-like motif
MRIRGRTKPRYVSMWLAWVLLLPQALLCSNCLASDSAPAQPLYHPGGPAAGSTVAAGKFSRVLVIRLKKGEDLLKGLESAVAQQGVRNGVFMGAFGSLTSYHVHVVNNTTFPPKNVYMKGRGPYDILSVTGAVIDGRLHPHLTFSDSKKALGGHLEEGSLVFTFAVITLGVLEDGISMDKFDDWNWQ